jgi:peptide/nickel transport system substrate-binding protein
VFGYPLNTIPPGNIYAGFCLEGLIQGTEQPLVYAPCLATSWVLAPDKSSYTFNLRKGVKFHDGTDFNAEAVKWNLDNIIKAKRVEVAYVTSVDIIDTYTVKINLSNWDILTMDGLSRNVTNFISPTAFAKNGVDWANVNPIGTGPFIMKEFARSQYVKYVRNNNYWEPNVPYLDAVEVIAVANFTTQQAVLQKGDAEGSIGMDLVAGKNLIDSGKYLAELGAQGNFGLSFNSEDPSSAWSKLEMRAALEYALDKQTMSDSLGNGFTHPIWNVIGGIYETPGNNPGTTPRKFDPAKAAQMIKDAGYPNGLKTTLELNSKFNSDFVTAIQSQLGKVGITIEIVSLPQAAYSEKQLLPVSPNGLRYNRSPGGPFDMVRSVKEQLITTSLFYKGVKRPAGWDDLIKMALNETDPAKVIAIYNQMEQKAYSEVMMVPIFAQQDINIWSKLLQNDTGHIGLRGGNNSPTITKYTYFVK